jgi:hypothetical protein
MDMLICHTSNCEHNVKSKCLAGIVSVNEKGVCLTKVKREGGILSQTFADIEAAEDFDILDTNHSSVQCKCSECVHNDIGLCYADHIVVDDALIRTKCITKTLRK